MLRGAAVRRFADDGAAGLRAADPPFDGASFDVALGEAGFADVPFADVPFVDDLDCFFGAALPLATGAVPLAFFAPEALAPDPAPGADDGRAPEPRAEPEGRAGRREEGMGRLCRFAGPLYGHYLRRAVCRNAKVRPSPAIPPTTVHGYGPNPWVGADLSVRAPNQPWKRGNADRPA
ncbi:hypothetical protein APR04_003291 [Promicromonospora umidemergens]|uniref:Uncharacterized protein n=1 Tax=Promicromonospora umidemergens TaxID=629679 RepID=A0ABP8WD26_9MICO|nr:hypothetical protein [Promicromonospora umidemergens]